MDKDKFAAFLTENGFSASVIDGTVMITTDHVLSPADIKLVMELKETAGYDSSFGWHTKRPDKN